MALSTTAGIAGVPFKYTMSSFLQLVRLSILVAGMKYGILEFGKLFQNGSIYGILTKQFFFNP